MHRKKTLFSMLLLVTLVLPIALKNSAVAQSTTNVSVINPSTGGSAFTFYTNTTSVGFRFNATVNVSDVNALYAYQAFLSVNDLLLNITGAWVPRDDPSWVFYSEATAGLNATLRDDDKDGSNEAVKIGDTILAGQPTFNGTGLLAIIEFKILRSPPIQGNVFSSLSIDNTDTFLLDNNLNDIPTTKTEGYYEYKWPPLPPKPWLEVAPPLVEYKSSPSPLGKHFNITVQLKGLEAAWKLVNITLSLSYDPTLIKSIDAIEGPFLKGFGNTKFSKNIGTDEVNVTNALDGLPTTYPTGEGTITTITFNITYQGITKEVKESPLILTVKKLIDKDGNLIPLDATKIVDEATYRISSLTASTINLIVAPTTVTVGSNVTIAGAITVPPPLPSPTEANVTIYYRLEGENWALLQTVKTQTDGSYTYNWPTTEAGSYQLKANWTGDTNTLLDESDVKNVRVAPLPPSSFDILPYVLIAETIVIVLLVIGMYFLKFRK